MCFCSAAWFDVSRFKPPGLDNKLACWGFWADWQIYWLCLFAVEGGIDRAAAGGSE